MIFHRSIPISVAPIDDSPYSLFDSITLYTPEELAAMVDDERDPGDIENDDITLSDDSQPDTEPAEEPADEPAEEPAETDAPIGHPDGYVAPENDPAPIYHPDAEEG